MKIKPVRVEPVLRIIKLAITKNNSGAYKPALSFCDSDLPLSILLDCVSKALVNLFHSGWVSSDLTIALGNPTLKSYTS